MLANKLFLDASYVIALTVLRDEHHARALDLRTQIQSQNILTDALTTDRHFEQAGFRALLRAT